DLAFLRRTAEAQSAALLLRQERLDARAGRRAFVRAVARRLLVRRCRSSNDVYSRRTGTATETVSIGAVLGRRAIGYARVALDIQMFVRSRGGSRPNVHAFLKAIPPRTARCFPIVECGLYAARV